jgi:signal transduction histidine kinase
MEQAIRNLTRLVTHELRTPVTSMTMIQDIIARQLGQVTPSQLEELIESMGSGSRRLSHLVEQMVFVTHLDAGTISRDSIANDGVVMPISKLLPTTVNLARRFSYLDPKIDVRVDMRHKESMVDCDPAALKHAFAELISNALNYSPTDGKVLVKQWQADDTIWITIDDQGEGIAEDKLQQALEAFQQIDREIREQQGMGLGTFVANRIIDAHGGKLELKSEVGKGTQAVISLPTATN